MKKKKDPAMNCFKLDSYLKNNLVKIQIVQSDGQFFKMSRLYAVFQKSCHVQSPCDCSLFICLKIHKLEFLSLCLSAITLHT